jgi:multiple sugar transport system permease protein
VRAALALLLWCAALVVGAQPITLRYAVTDGADSLGVVEGIVKEFEAKHPKIKIKIEPIVDSYAQKLMAMYAASISPDVARMAPQDYQPMAARGVLLPLDDFIKNDPSVKLADYYPNIVRFFTYENKLYSLPREVAPTGLIYYNKRLFDEAKVPYPSPDWTWSYQPRPNEGAKDFTWMMGALTRKDAKGRTFQYGYSSSWPQLMLETLMLSRGLKLWDSNEKPMKMMATEPEVIELVTFASDVVNKHKWAPSQTELTSANTSQRDLFLQGKLAMYQSGPWEILKFRREMKGLNAEWDVVPFPAYVGSVNRTKGEGSGTSIFATTRYPKEAWDFAKFMSGPPGMTAMARAGLNQPAIRRLATQPGIWLPAADATGDAAKPRGIAVTDRAAASMVIDLVPEYFRPIANLCQGKSYDVLTGVNPPIKTMEDLQRTASRDLANQIRRQETSPYPTNIALLLGFLITAGIIAWVYLPERGVKYTSAAKKENRSAYLFLIPWVFGLAFTLGPMLYSLFLSLAESDMIKPPKWVGVRNYTDALFLDDSVPISLRQTFIYAIFSIPLGLVSALALSLLLNQKVKGIPLYRALFYMPSLASGVAMSLIWMRVFNPDSGLLNHIIYNTWPLNATGLGEWMSYMAGKPGEPVNWLANVKTVIPAFVIMGMWGAGGGTVIFLAGLQGISTSYYEAATSDGANVWRKFRNVTLPLLTPTIFFSLITGIIGALQVFTQAVVMTGGGPDRATLFMVVYLYSQAFQSLQMGYASALAWILFTIILVITVIQLQASKRWVYYEGDIK